MIIGINGKIGSGKDTIGLIIQGLFLTRRNELSEIKKFAGKLKQTASLLTGIPIEKFEDQEFKKQYMPEEWNSFVSVDFPEMTGEEIKDSDSILVETTYKRMTYREFLQRLGTEAMRDGLHENVWVNALFADYVETESIFRGKVIEKDPLPNWIITDMRFPNEMKAVVERGGLTIKVVRPGVLVGTHASEIALDDSEFNYEIENNGTIKDLIEKVKQILM